MSILLKNFTILVIDDDPDSCDLLRSLLLGYGANVLVANSVDAALAVFRQSPPHLVLSDIRLGSSDGFALIEAIRTCNKEYRGFTPAIAMTGFGSPGDEERALAAGFSAYLQKPLNAKDLIRSITSVLRSSPEIAA